MGDVAKFIAQLLVAPLSLTLGLFSLAVIARLRGLRRMAVSLATIAFVGLWLASTSGMAELLGGHLESRFPAIAADKSPTADAVVVLGGSVAGASPPTRPIFNLGPASGRVWHAASLYRAGKAPLIIIAAGDDPPTADYQPEWDAIAQMLGDLGVPGSALRIDKTSRNTRQNAMAACAIASELHVKSVLLVTSGLHMPRAMGTFEKMCAHTNIRFEAAPADIAFVPTELGWDAWIPTASGLAFVTRALKEYAGLLALSIIA